MNPRLILPVVLFTLGLTAFFLVRPDAPEAEAQTLPALAYEHAVLTVSGNNIELFEATRTSRFELVANGVRDVPRRQIDRGDYRQHLTAEHNPLVGVLNLLGQEGWAVVSEIQSGDSIRLMLRRPADT